MREKTRMYMPGIYVDHLSNRIRDMFESNRITSCNPNNRHNDNDHSG